MMKIQLIGLSKKEIELLHVTENSGFGGGGSGFRLVKFT